MQRKPTKNYFRAYAGLYGEKLNLTELAKIGKAPKKRKNLEDIEQIKFNFWFDEFLWGKGYRWFHPANGGSRSLEEGSKFKRMGVKPGVPDIILPMAKKPYHGLVIELKRIDGVPSDVSAAQRDWLEWFRLQDWSVHVAYGFDDAKRILMEYFK